MIILRRTVSFVTAHFYIVSADFHLHRDISKYGFLWFYLYCEQLISSKSTIPQSNNEEVIFHETSVHFMIGRK
jgi:hypothetical protein